MGKDKPDYDDTFHCTPMITFLKQTPPWVKSFIIIVSRIILENFFWKIF
jgi:hypothetical protein